jgi:hypothetical protein
MSIGVHPFIWIAAFGSLTALIAVIVACKARSRHVFTIMLVLALVLIAPAAYLFLTYYPELIDGRFRTYRGFYRDIQVGMTREQVFAAMERRYPKDGPRLRPRVMRDELASLGFFMNAERSSEPNCEGIFLKLEVGRVVSKKYSPD